MADPPHTPTLEKIHKVHELSQSIGYFLEAMSDQGFVICRAVPDERLQGLLGEWQDTYDYDKFDRETVEAFLRDVLPAFEPTHASINDLLALHFDIDQQKAEEERRALLEYIRSSDVTDVGKDFQSEGP